MTDWFAINAQETVGIFLTVFLLNFIILVIVRLNGLRTFSKMSAHDFAVTVAIGSILGTAVTSPSPSLGSASVAIAMLVLWQHLFSRWRRKRNQSYLENDALIIAEKGQLIEKNLKSARMTNEDFYAKMREANVMRMSDVKLAVLEVTGDVSILHGDGTPDDVLTNNLIK